MSKREQILVALHDLLKSVDPAILRNVAVGTVEGDVFNTLRDGGLEETDMFFNPPIHEFTATPNLILVIERGPAAPTLDSLLDERIGGFVAAIEQSADTDLLGGLATAIRVQPADFAPKELFGTEDKKGAEVTIEIDYWSEHSSG